jgi:hypothetical protein
MFASMVALAIGENVRQAGNRNFARIHEIFSYRHGREGGHPRRRHHTLCLYLNLSAAIADVCVDGPLRGHDGKVDMSLGRPLRSCLMTGLDPVIQSRQQKC